MRKHCCYSSTKAAWADKEARTGGRESKNSMLGKDCSEKAGRVRCRETSEVASEEYN